MRRIVDHDKRRDDIARVAYRIVATHGFDQASMIRIARETGCTTGMLAHYFESKHDIVIAALRLSMRRVDERLRQHAASAACADLSTLLVKVLPLENQRRTESAFWVTFWAQATTDKRLRRINRCVYREHARLCERCLRQYWAEWSQWPATICEQVLYSFVTFINGLIMGIVANANEWPPGYALKQLRLQVKLLHGWATESSAVLNKRPPANHGTLAGWDRAHVPAGDGGRE